MRENDRLNDHQRFRELAAVAQGRGLTAVEWAELKCHLQACETCRAVSAEYSLLSAGAMAFMAADGGYVWEADAWDSQAARDELWSRIRSRGPSDAGADSSISPPAVRAGQPGWLWSPGARWVAGAAVAACLLVAVGAGTYHLGNRRRTAEVQTSSAVEVPSTPAALGKLIAEKNATDDLLAEQSSEISRLQKQIAGQEHDLTGLRSSLRAAEVRYRELAKANGEGIAQFRQVSGERDKLAAQLRDAEKAYQVLQVDFTNLRAEHDRFVLRTASLESKIEDLSAATRDQDRRLKDSEQYLASDRDIRELMGARKLYIADVFDVDSGSRTRKPFGRVFYTQNKSLIFYAFDLDRKPGVKNASAFQVWGQKEGDLSAKTRPMNLGILYMDSETNRRWVLRWDDPKQLAEIDAVFVTVEPSGGSQKPTGKPFLYALLRKEANHP
jgi:anti-sigma-K factor RskA